MSRKKQPTKPEDVRRLKYNGGPNGYPHIIGVPSRDLNFYDLVNLADRMECETEDVVALLTDAAPGRKTPDGRPLYQPDKPWSCAVCGEKFQDWHEYNKHEIESHVEVESGDK
jgi:hypothetical protein